MWFSCASSEKKLRWVNFPPLRKKKLQLPPEKTMKNVLHYLEQQKKVWKKSCKKSWKTIEKKNMKKTTKHTQKTYDEWKKIIERSDNFLSQKNEKNKNF